MSTTLRPWTQVAMPHDDVRDDAAVKAEYAVNLGRVDRGDDKLTRHYADPKIFFEATYLTADLHRLLSDVMAALTGKKVDRVLQLRTPFGGGKTHSLVALLHLARSRKALVGIKDLKDIPDPGATRVAVLPCADFTPGSPRKMKGGPTIHTLWGELAFRLGGAEAYQAVKNIDERMTAPGGEDLESIVTASKQSTLILADEVLLYVEKAMTVPAGDSTLGRQTLAFLQHLTETVAGEPKAAFVYSLQASVAEALGDEGLLQTLDKLVGRVDARRVPVQDGEVKEIIRRRLFKSLGDEAVRREVADEYAEEYRRYASASAETKADRARVDEEVKQLQEEIRAGYPFHPTLVRLMYERWGSLPSYQRTRGALQFLGTIVHVLFKRGHVGALIGPGDVPLDDPDVRAEFFRQVGEREQWDSVLDADIAGQHARARQVDRRIGESSPALAQARIGSTTATAITLYSFGARRDEMRGVTQSELVATCLRPGIEAPVVQSAVGELRESLLYLHSSAGRLRMDTVPSLTKLIEESVGAVSTEDVTGRVQDTLTGLLKTASTAVLWPDHAGRIPDGRREFLLAYLPLEWAERPPSECETGARELVISKSGGERGGVRRFRNGLGFAIPQKSHADQARALARRALALEMLRRKAKVGQVQVSGEQLDELDEKLRAAVKDLDGACRGMYGQVLLPVRSKETGEPVGLRTVELGTLAATGGDLHARIMELLKKQVFDEITVDRFVELVGVDGSDGQAFAGVTEALDAFFAFLDRPKMRSDAPLLTALASAVLGRKLGYLPSARVEGNRLVPTPGVSIRFGTSHDPEEFAGEDGAYILSGSLAASLAGPAKVDPIPKPTPTEGDDQGQRPLIGVTPVPKGTAAQRYVLRAAVDRKHFIKLSQALNQLYALSASMNLRVEVDAHQPAGFDPVKLRNTVQEPLTEAGIEHEGGAGE
jgi:Protein of unknown function (DUF499)